VHILASGLEGYGGSAADPDTVGWIRILLPLLDPDPYIVKVLDPDPGPYIRISTTLDGGVDLI